MGALHSLFEWRLVRVRVPVGFAPGTNPFVIHHPVLAWIATALVFVAWAAFVIGAAAIFIVALLWPIAALCRFFPRVRYVYVGWKQTGRGLALAWCVAAVWIVVLLR